MSNVTITNLPAALSVTGTDKIPAVQNGTTVYITASQIGTYFNANYPFPTISAGYLIGNATAGTAVASAVSYSSLMDIAIGATQGQMIYRNVGNWVALDPGIIGQVLRTGGPNSDPFWDTVTGTGTVYSIGIGTNLTSTQTPITTTGTISTVMNPAFTTSVTTPSIYGGSSVSQTLLLQSTTGVGTSDSILMKVGNNGATTAVSISSAGVVTLSSALPVTSGGTGQTSALTTNGVVYGSSTTAMATTAVGTTGQVLVATTGGAPSFGAIPSTAAVTSIGFGTTGLTPASATTGVVTVAGTLVAVNGGTGQTSYTVGDLLYADTTTTLAKLADVAIGAVLVSGGVAGNPSYSASPTLTTSLTTPLLIGGTTASSTLTLQSTSGVGTTDKILFKVGNNGAVTGGTIGTTGNWGFGGNATTFIGLAVPLDITGATSAYGQRINGNVQSDVTTLAAAYFSNIALANASFTTTDLVHFLANPPSGGAGSTATNQYGFKANSTLASNGAATVTNSYGFYSDLASASNKWNYFANGTANNAFAGDTRIGSVVTPTKTLDITGTLGVSGAVTFSTALPVASGGTGATTANAALTNLTTFTTTATAGGTTVLTNTSTYFQFFTGTLTQTITLPVTSTLGQGWTFHIVNNGTGDLTVNSSGGNFLITVLAGTTAMATCILTSGTTAASWEAGLTDFSTATGTGSVVLSASPTLVTPALGVATATSVAIGGATIGANALAVTGSVLFNTALAATSGGTGQSSYAVGDLLYASTTTALSGLADVATGQVLVSRGVGVAPSYSASPTATNWYNTATQTATNTATLTAAQITGPFLLGTPTATASYTLPLASAVETALGTPPNETGWEFVVFTTAAFAITLLTNTGWTLVGSMATGATANSFARFRCRKTGAAAYSIYRIS